MFKKLRAIISAINRHPLAGRHKIKAYRKFLQWQLLQTLVPRTVKKQFVHDTRLLVKKGMTGATGNIYCGLHEFEDMGFLLHFLREKDVFIDIGANIGSYTVLASGVCKAHSISFEPVPSTFRHLQDNIQINRLQANTRLYNAAAGAGEGTLKFTSEHDTVNHVLADNEQSGNSVEVRVLSVDQVVDREENIRLIKIDAEGFETEVLNGMQALLKNDDVKAIIIELNGSGARYGYSEKNIDDKLKAHGFVCFTYDPFLRRLKKPDALNSLNSIYLRDLPFVMERIDSASLINLFSESF